MATERADAAARTRWSLLLRVGLATAVLAVLFRRVAPEEVLAVVRSVSYPALSAAFGAIMVMHVVVAYRITLLIRALGAAARTAELLAISLATVFYGLVLPGGALVGATVRVYRLSRLGGTYGLAVLAVVYDRLLATAAIGAIGLVCWLLDGDEKPRAALVPLVLASAAALALLVPQRLLPARLGTIAEALKRVRGVPPRTMARLLALSALAQVPAIASLAILSAALDLELPILSVAWIRSVALVVTAIPISIAGLGVREGTLLFLLRAYRVRDEAALALSLLLFAVTFVGPGVVGGMLEALRAARARGAGASPSGSSAARPGTRSGSES